MKFFSPGFTAIAAIAGILALPAIAQHAHDVPAASPAQPASDPHAGHTAQVPVPETSQPPADPHAGHAMPTPPGDHSGHEMPAETPQAAADLPVGQDPAPPPIALGAADSIFGAAAMGAARETLASEHGGAFVWKIMLDQAEYRAGPGGPGYGWSGEAWFGGDLHRLVLKSEGEGTERDGLEDGEWQALYSRAIGPYTDLQLGVRQDFGGFAATYATFGVETILPYWLKAEAAFFVSTRGDALARLEGSYDLLLTQHLVLQPNLELNFAMQDIPGALIGSGLSQVSAGLRLRYDINRQFSPYIGVNFDRKIGGTADFHRAAGDAVEGTSLVLGIRAFL